MSKPRSRAPPVLSAEIIARIVVANRPVPRREAAPCHVDGRGLLVVDKLATDWGIERRATHKVVWFEIVR
jgi:hypothetical protein